MFELFDPRDDYRVRRGRGLPHWFQPMVSYFVTFRTKDSIPANILRRWNLERLEWLGRHGAHAANPQVASRPADTRNSLQKWLCGRYMRVLDKGMGECVLAEPEMRAIVTESLHRFDGVRYDLGDYVVMPNHVHVIVGLLGDTHIESLCNSWKRRSARQINRQLDRKGRFWQEGSFDHLIRTPEQFRAIQRYIAENPGLLRPDQYTLYHRDTNEGQT